MNKQEIINFLSTQSNIFELLREDDFKLSKELWPDFVHQGCWITLKKEELVKHVCEFMSSTTIYAFEYHLQQAVLLPEDKVMDYLKGSV